MLYCRFILLTKTHEVLHDLQIGEKPRVSALNKIDLLDDPSELDLSLYPNAVPVSALKHIGLDSLREKIAQVLADSMEMVQVMIPYEKSELVELFHRRGRVDLEEHRAEGTFLAGRLSAMSTAVWFVAPSKMLRFVMSSM